MDVKGTNDVRLLSKEWNIYLVNGRLVWIMYDAIDPATDAGMERLIRTANAMDKGPFGMLHGPYSVCRLYPKEDTPFGLRHTKEIIAPKWLPKPLREILRKELPEHADEF